MMAKVSDLEQKFLYYMQILAQDLPLPQTQVKHKGLSGKRRWRFDFAYPELKIAIETEGGVYSQGRHSRAAGYSGDCDKYNEAAVLGWLVLRFTALHMDDPQKMIDTVRKAYEVRRDRQTARPN